MPTQRLRLRLPLALLFAAALCAVACDSNLACPPGYNVLGNFNVAFTPIDAGAACMITRKTDGGPADASLLNTPAATLLLLCGAHKGDAGDGTFSLSYSFRGTGTHNATLDGGAFSQANTAGGQSGSACLCPIDLTETISGELRTADGGAFGLEQDGGLSPVVGVSGSSFIAVSASAGSSHCACTLPCATGFSYLSQ